jgi:DNA polymerase IV
MTGEGGTGVPDDTGCHILHVDMDAFYAGVEIRDRPELAGRPVIVGSPSGRSVVLSASYEARAFGVRSAMPATQARRLCPQAIFIPPRRGVYSAVSKEVMAVFRSITPLVEPLSLDEAFLDVAGAVRRLGRPAGIGAMIRRQIVQEQGVTCSVGVAPSKFVAKIASARCKPDGLLVIPRDGVLGFLHPLPVSALWGVGERTGQILARLGLRTVGDIAHAPLATLQHDLGAALGSHLAALAWGRDDRAVVPHAPEKSLGAEETFPADIGDPEVIRRELLRLSERTARALRDAGCVARTVTVKLRLASFTTITRSRTLAEPTDLGRKIYATACALHAAAGLDHEARLRLVGVRVTGLAPAGSAATQLAFGDRPTGWREAEQAMDRIARRFGTGAVRPATLVEPGPDPDETFP